MTDFSEKGFSVFSGIIPSEVEHFDLEMTEIRKPEQLLRRVKGLVNIEHVPNISKFHSTVTKHSQDKLKEELEAEWDMPPFRPRSDFLGTDTDLVPGSRALGFYVGSGITWKDFRSTGIHARNLRTLVFESLAEGRGIPDNCKLLIAATESLSGKIIYDLVEKLMDRLQSESFPFRSESHLMWKIVSENFRIWTSVAFLSILNYERITLQIRIFTENRVILMISDIRVWECRIVNSKCWTWRPFRLPALNESSGLWAGLTPPS